MKNIATIAILIFAFAGCKDDEQPEPNKTIWQEMEHFKGRDKILLNSRSLITQFFLEK